MKSCRTSPSHHEDGIYLEGNYKDQINRIIQDAYRVRGRYEELTDPKYSDEVAIFDIKAMTVIDHRSISSKLTLG